ncbi:TetR/AcrR family transcriptional regulator [Microbacterium rhizomatis]|uniref:TetR family transcriptional regulator n=1 Tax=Microbacterium rhizomatis TaxID=1631477 RepID=A0A5J5IY10_9MICO|nr:TetR family transcriptional regulator [Microbacterium rhizomatis]KAA9106325.1 TetR family transcriptional regulator [Microbacterium rhizomatis]
MTTEAPPQRPQRRDALQNRQTILDAARRALAVDPAASLGTIALDAGLSRRALYGHFEDRDALIRELVTTGARRFNDIADGVTDDDPRLALARLASLLWQDAAHVQVAAAIALDDAHIDDTAAALAPLRRRLVEIVREGQSRDALRTDIAAPTLARLIEEAARSVITRVDGTSPAAHALAVKAVMSIAGLSWREAVALLAQHPDLLGGQS